MHLKRLEIQGFKSFAQKTALEFEPGITAIVGPNGSGKSNVADSIRWILGEQSVKQLRGKKSDDVIFAGSDKRTRGSFAEVIATFDNADRRIPLDSSEVSIGRRVDRSGESEYLINGARVRLLDIIDLVLKSNIGTSRYTVIGQGTIDQLILAGPAEIKGLLDEASGVKTYHVRREKTLKRLDQTAQNLMRAQDVVNELEPRLKSLRRQAKRMEAREGIELELKVLLRERLGGSFYVLSNQVAELTRRLQAFTEQRQAIEEQIRAAQEKIEKEAQGESSEAARFATLRRDLLSLQEQKNRLFEQRSILQGKLASAKSGAAGDPRTLQLQAHQLELKLQALEEQLARANQELAGSVEQVQHLQHERANVEKHLQELYAVLAEPDTVDRDAFAKAMDGLHNAVDSFLERVESAQNLLQIQELTSTFKHSYADLKHTAHAVLQQGGGKSVERQEELQKLHVVKSRIEQELSTLSARRASAETSVRLLEEQKQALSQEHLDVRLELQKASSTGTDSFVEQLTSESTRIEQEVATLQARMRSIEEELAKADAGEAQRRQLLSETERHIRTLQDAISKLRDQESGINIEKARYDTQLESLTAEIEQVFGADLGSEVMRTAAPSTTPNIDESIAKFKHQLELIGGVDEMTMQEYRETEERFTRLSDQIADLNRSMEDLKQVMDELDEHIKTRFNEAFHKINERFENYFRVLFNGGRAQLTLVRAKDEAAEEALEANEAPEAVGTNLRPEEKLVQKYEAGSSNVVGVDMKATPPGKKLANIQALSGGERALTSIALLCALLACFPSPFVVLDEVDAALDEANTIRFGQILGTLAHQTQFVTISHNRETMAQSTMLYGVTMGDDSVSKILSLKFDQATEYAK